MFLSWQTYVGLKIASQFAIILSEEDQNAYKKICMIIDEHTSIDISSTKQQTEFTTELHKYFENMVVSENNFTSTSFDETTSCMSKREQFKVQHVIYLEQYKKWEYKMESKKKIMYEFISKQYKKWEYKMESKKKIMYEFISKHLIESDFELF